MNLHCRLARRVVFAGLTLALGLSLTYAQTPGITLTQMSSDPFTVPPGQHATEVEPHMLANGATLVAAFQTGRIADGGGTAIGWATSTDGGSTWSHGFLPGLTKGEGSGPYDAASDPAVAFDAKHGVWMIASLPISNTSETTAVTVNRSTDGGLPGTIRSTLGRRWRVRTRTGLFATAGRRVRIMGTAMWSGTIRIMAMKFS